MKVGKIFIVGLVGLLMAGSLMLLSCKDACNIEQGGCSYSISSDGESIRDISICADSGCRVVKDIKDFEPKPGSCSCK